MTSMELSTSARGGEEMTHREAQALVRGRGRALHSGRRGPAFATLSALGFGLLAGCGSSDPEPAAGASGAPSVAGQSSAPGGAPNMPSTQGGSGGVAAPGPSGGAPSPAGGAGNVPASGLPGVQVKPQTGDTTCIPLCVKISDPAQDPQGDDWGWEGGSCIIPNTATATNDACTTGAPLPAKAPRPGVVIRGATGERACAPLCIFYESPTQKGANSDGFADDWAYENNATCVIPKTVTAATSLTCTTEMPIAPEQSRPGVVVRNPTSMGLECVALCTYFKTRNQPGADSDNLGDDWAYEFGGSCIIPGTVTAANQSCATLQPVPPPEPRPGIMVNADPVMDSCSKNACVPLCKVITTATNPLYPDWGWENNNSCVIPGSPTATVIPKSVENSGYAVPPRRCTSGAPPTNFLAPPPLAAARTVRPHFQTVGAQLRDPYDRPFLIRAINNSNAWYDICGQYAAFEALDNIAAQGANAVRVGWAFRSIDPGGPLAGDASKPVIGTNPQLLAEILHRVVELKMIPILAPNDSTGQTTTDWPARMAGFLTGPGYLEVLQAYAPYLLIGIANEWNGTDFYAAYNAAIQIFRERGINSTLVVTANDWGQGCDAVLTDGARLRTADPRGNLLFDMHIYNYLTLRGAHGGDASFVQGCMDAIAAAGLPLLVGEFGNTHGGMPVQWQTVVARANANSQGYAPWLWYGDTEFPALNLATRWEGPLSAWGSTVLPLNGVKASIFP